MDVYCNLKTCCAIRLNYSSLCKTEQKLSVVLCVKLCYPNTLPYSVTHRIQISSHSPYFSTDLKFKWHDIVVRSVSGPSVTEGIDGHRDTVRTFEDSLLESL